MDIKTWISELTLEEKAGLCSGADFWHTKAVERLGIPSIMVSDGPHGLRKMEEVESNMGFGDSILAVCFPTGSAAAASFDRDMMTEMGQALGDTCQAKGVNVILGPAANIKRSPLCGRNFEYFSEDPYLSGEIAAAHIKGVQSRHVGTSLKHFLANSQEHRRMTSSSTIDERTLREIYLTTFEIPVKQAKPWTLMCSYNRINGTFASENRRFLTQVLRDEWGFDGLVMSDWGAVNDRPLGVDAGLDLEMPGSQGLNDSRIVAAVQEGRLSEEALNQAVKNVLKLVLRTTAHRDPDAVFDMEGQHVLARQMAGKCAVLLKNEHNILPLNPEQQKIALIGEFAETPRYQGGGSSHIHSFRVTGAIEACKEMFGAQSFEASETVRFVYAKGYTSEEDKTDDGLLAEAVAAAKNSDVAVIFAGLPDAFESEGYDRRHMRMPDCQNRLIEEICKVQDNVVVVLHNGSPVEMPWADQVSGILEMYLGGQAVGGAAVDILFGKVNPSGCLAESFPKKLEDNPSYLYYFGEGDRVEYREGIFVGYRYYDKKNMEVLFPFGHGLSYTSFAFENLQLSQQELWEEHLAEDAFGTQGDTLKVTVEVVNTGAVAGEKVVQLYVADQDPQVIRPIRELKGFTKVFLAPGERQQVEFTLLKRAFAYYDTERNKWSVSDGAYTIEIGHSSRDIACSASLVMHKKKETVYFTPNSTVSEAMRHPAARKALMPLIGTYILGIVSKEEAEVLQAMDSSVDEKADEMAQAIADNMPLRGIISFGGTFTYDQLLQTLEELNEQIAKED